MAEDVYLSEGVLITDDGTASPTVDDLTARGDLTVAGELRTGSPWVPGGIVFGGIDGEGRVLPAAALASPTATMVFGDGVPRVSLPAGVQTDVYATFALEEWWLNDTLGMYIEWTNDHTALGNVRWQFELKEIDIATQKLSQGGVVATKTTTHDGSSLPSVSGGTMTTICFSVAAGDTIAFNPGPFASFYSLRMTRLGADALDTLAGPVGIVEFSYVRGR